jgi:hypothetical protein
LPSRRGPVSWLLEKEWRELWSAPAWWVMLLLTGPIVGACFGRAVSLYAELSAAEGAAAAGDALSPLLGVWAPTFSAYELVAAFLLPFVAIRLVAGDRQSGVLDLEQQQPLGAAIRLGAKAAVLGAAWVIASIPGAMAVAAWSAAGGAVHGPEIAGVVLGHLLNAALTIGLAVAVAAIADHPATAAVLALGVTVGTWVLDFAAAVHGGVWQTLAAFTPPVLVGAFQRGLVRLDLVLAAMALAAGGVAVGAVWLRTGTTRGRRAAESLAVAALAAACAFASLLARTSWDVSENRANSFPRADEAALAAIRSPLTVEPHLAPEDPRRLELERRVLAKLRRAVPDLRVRYVSSSTSGLFEQAEPEYGEIFYLLDGRRASTRSTTAEDTLEILHGLTGREPDPSLAEDVFRGHPLPRPPAGIALTFYAAWPALVAGAATFAHRRSS